MDRPGKIVVYVFSGILLFDNMTGHVIMKSEFYHDNAFTCVTSDNVSQCIKVQSLRHMPSYCLSKCSIREAKIKKKHLQTSDLMCGQTN